MNDEIAVSILCTAYNHEKYIKKCLDGFVSQECNFKFEIVIHDDCSQDGTQDIIKQYQKKYPALFKIILQTENKYSKGEDLYKNYLLPLAKGKYVAFCEGDDYWANKNKLHKQYDIMEENRNVSICVHRVRCINESDQRLNLLIPKHYYPTGVVSTYNFLRNEYGKARYFANTTSIFIRTNTYRDYYDEEPEFAQGLGFGDLPLKLYMVTKGNMYYINKIMSCYRLLSIGSFNEKMRCNNQFIKTKEEQLIMANQYNIYTDYRFNNIMVDYINHIKAEILIRKKNLKPLLFDDCFKIWRKRKWPRLIKEMLKNVLEG